MTEKTVPDIRSRGVRYWDLAPWSFDRDLRPQLFCGDQISEQREAGAHARSFVPAVLDQPGLVATAQ